MIFFPQDGLFYYHPFLIYFSMKVIETGQHFKTNLDSKYNSLQDNVKWKSLVTPWTIQFMEFPPEYQSG